MSHCGLNQQRIEEQILKDFKKGQQLRINFEGSTPTTTCVSFEHFETSKKLKFQFDNNNNNHCKFGEAFISAFTKGEFNRIIVINTFIPICFENGKIISCWTWLKTILNNRNDEFDGLICFDDSSHARNSLFKAPIFICDSTLYDLVCNLIKHDKIVSIGISFPNIKESFIIDRSNNNNKLTINLDKLTEALKSTNILNEFGIVNGSLCPSYVSGQVPCLQALTQGKYEYKNLPQTELNKIENAIKNGLLVNYSVTALYICFACYSRMEPGENAYGGTVGNCNKYHLWWNDIKKRNIESENTNKVLSNDLENKNNTWNINNCHYNMSKKLLNIIFNGIPNDYFDNKQDRCFCYYCCHKRNEKSSYYRGNPKKKYAIPNGWIRFGLNINNGKAKMNKVFENWHVSYHGTSSNNVINIFKSGLSLLKAGDVAIDGNEITILKGHIKKPFKRFNQYYKKEELFDPNMIFTSPSIKYASHPAYAKSLYVTNPENRKEILKVQFAFQCRQRPDSYTIGQETVGAKKGNKKLDNVFSNDELEWYTK